VTMADHHTVDQRQVNQNWLFLVNDTRWCAQSFVPSVNSISEVELCVAAWDSGRNLTVSIRESLDGPDLAEAEKNIEETGWDTVWKLFGFSPVAVTPGETYYIICRGSSEGWGTGWAASGGDMYGAGSFYTSTDAGNNWEEDWKDVDGCFVTYG